MCRSISPVPTPPEHYIVSSVKRGLRPFPVSRRRLRRSTDCRFIQPTSLRKAPMLEELTPLKPRRKQMSIADEPLVTADEHEHYDALLTANAATVFSEPAAEKRMTSLRSLWSESGTLIEKEAVYTGYEAISASVDATLALLPPGTTFAADGGGSGHHGIARLRWRATNASGALLGVSGTDIAFVKDGRIQRLVVILDDAETRSE